MAFKISIKSLFCIGLAIFLCLSTVHAIANMGYNGDNGDSCYEQCNAGAPVHSNGCSAGEQCTLQVVAVVKGKDISCWYCS